MSDDLTVSRGDLLLGVDIGGTKILAGLVERSGHILCKQRTETRPGHLLADTVAACRGLIEAAARAGRRVGGIGIGAKGAVDSDRRRLVESLYLGHGEICIGDALERAFGLPVCVENDVHAATVGEQLFGIGREVRDFIYYNAGTGIAIGIVVGGRLYKGASNTAGENGHAVLDHSRRWPCPCGMSGCLETMIVSGRDGAVLPLVSVGSDALADLDRAYAYLACSMDDLIGIFDPAAFVLGGGMLTNNPRATVLLTEYLTQHRKQQRPLGLRVVPAFAGYEAGLLGAAALTSLQQQATANQLPNKRYNATNDIA